MEVVGLRDGLFVLKLDEDDGFEVARRPRAFYIASGRRLVPALSVLVPDLKAQ